LVKRKQHLEQERQTIQTRLEQFQTLARRTAAKETMLQDFSAMN
jgi:hypothetical protein